MTGSIKKKSKIVKRIFIGLSIVLIAAIVVVGLLWNRYLNKNSLLKKFGTTQNQEVYLLGSLQFTHFKK